MQLQFERTYESVVLPGVQFKVKRISLAERMRFLADNHRLMQKLKFLAAAPGEEAQERGCIAEFELELSRRLLEACLIGIFEQNGEGLTEADPATWLLQKAPTSLCLEVLARVCEEIALTEEKRKN